MISVIILGIAFQIKDDLFDILGSEFETGKNSNSDVKKNMITLPLIHARSKMSRIQKRKLNKLLRKKNKKNKSTLSSIRELITEAGGIQYTIDKMEEYSNLALKAISNYPESPIKVSLIDLVSYNGSRIK